MTAGGARRHRRVLAAAALAAAAVLAGFLAERAVERRAAAPAQRAVRLGMNDLINPLLECESAELAIGDRMLPPFREELAKQVDGMVRSGRVGRMAVYFRDLNNGPWLGVNTDDEFYPASLLKVPVAMAVMRQAERDPRLLKKRMRYEAQRDLNAKLVMRPRQQVREGRSYTVEDLIELTLTASDNNALQLLTRAVDRAVLAETFRDLGVRYPSAEQADFMSVKDFATFFRILYNASYLDRPSSEHLLALLSRTEFSEGLRAGVPEEVVIAHKYGEQSLGPDGAVKELHDCGIVYYPNSPYLLCVMSTGSSYESDAAAIREISQFIFGVVDRHQRQLAAGRPGDRR